ncbi:unnamed protein product [Arabidopsis halleri]
MGIMNSLRQAKKVKSIASPPYASVPVLDLISKSNNLC